MSESSYPPSGCIAGDIAGNESVKQIRELLDRAEYRRLFACARERFETAGGTPVRTLTLSDLDCAERRALADLLGKPTLPGEKVRISVEALDTALRTSRLATGLRDVLEVFGGPIPDRPALQARAREATEARWEDAAAHPAVTDHPALRGWLAELRARGLVARAARACGMDEGAMLTLALDVVQRLPAPGTALSVLAAECAGDAHALDPGRPLANLVLRAAARLAGWTSMPESGAERRRLWAEVGVLCDPLAAQVLTLGLRPSGDGRLARHLREWTESGEPRRLTLRELSTTPVVITEAAPVFVCENPAVVAAAADALGAATPPLVCVEGIPSTAAWTLLRGFAERGVRIAFHADFDWGGIRIGNLLHDRVGGEPWRFEAWDYDEAIAEVEGLAPLGPRSVAAVWDPGLQARLERAGRAIYEEQVIDRLLEDLKRTGRRRSRGP